MLRKLLLPFAFALLFALGQQAAVTHEISHYAELLPGSSHKAPHTQACDKCMGYGELASALATGSFQLVLLAAQYALASDHGASHTALTLAAYAARAPPITVSSVIV